MTDPHSLKQEILRLTREYSRLVHTSFRPEFDPLKKPWHEGSSIPYAGRVFTEDEVEAAVSSSLDFWLTLGSEGEAFQQELAAYLGVRYSVLVNSGSSANLLAISTLTSTKLSESRRLMPGDEVITVAAGFLLLLHRLFSWSYTRFYRRRSSHWKCLLRTIGISLCG